MKKIFYLFSLFACICSCKTPETTTLRIGSYNLWVSQIGKDDYAWEVRRERLAASIVDNAFDILGAQEVNTRIQEELPDLLKQAGAPDYSWFIFSPYVEDGGVGDKAQAILWKADKYEMSNPHHFWYSETPGEMSSGWDEQRFNRGGCCVTFRDKKTGIEFVFALSHMPLGKEANLHAAGILVDEIEKYNVRNLPAVFVGDLNTRPDTPSSDVLRAYWTDARLYLPEDKIEGPYGTFNNHDVERDMEKAPRIDYIYFKGGAEPQNYVCNTGKYDGFYPSDHCPIYSNILIHK